MSSIFSCPKPVLFAMKHPSTFVHYSTVWATTPHFRADGVTQNNGRQSQLYSIYSYICLIPEKVYWLFAAQHTARYSLRFILNKMFRKYLLNSGILTDKHTAGVWSWTPNERIILGKIHVLHSPSLQLHTKAHLAHCFHWENMSLCISGSGKWRKKST